MSEHTAILAICPFTAQAEKAIMTLSQMGFAPRDVSVFGRICANEEDVVGICASGGQIVACGVSASFWERMWDILGDGGFFIVPRIGQLAIAGSFVDEFVAAVDEHSLSSTFTALGDAMCRLGIARENVVRYELEIRASECALVALGTREQVAAAKIELYSLGVSNFTTGTPIGEHSAHEALQTVGQG